MLNQVTWALAGALLGFFASGCLVDNSHRCGTHQQYDGERCICDSGYGLKDTQCVACGMHEVGSLAGCMCESGYARASADAPCLLSKALGVACNTDKDCTDPTFSHCESDPTTAADAGADAGAGYCTKTGCKTSDDCDVMNDYACNDRSTPSFCQRPPKGLGKSCTTDADCAGSEASYCEALSSHACLVNHCKEDPNKCHGDWACCDIAILGGSICIPPVQLTAGACPAGGTLIPRSK